MREEEGKVEEASWTPAAKNLYWTPAAKNLGAGPCRDGLPGSDGVSDLNGEGGGGEKEERMSEGEGVREEST